MRLLNAKIFRMFSLPPPDCQPGMFKWIKSTALFVQIILYAMPWYNWLEMKTTVQRDIMSNEFVQIAIAKRGFWFKFHVSEFRQKTPVELFIRVVPLE